MYTYSTSKFQIFVSEDQNNTSVQAQLRVREYFYLGTLSETVPISIEWCRARQCRAIISLLETLIIVFCYGDRAYGAAALSVSHIPRNANYAC